MQKGNGVLWNTLGSTMYGVNSFIMLALVSRIGTVEQAGHFGIAFTTAQLLYIVGLFGVSHYHMTDYAEKYRFSSYAKARFISCCVMLACCAAAIFALGFTGMKRSYTIFLTILMLLNVVGELYQSLFFQKNRLDLSGSALFFRTFWSLGVFCAVALITRNLLWAVIAQIVTNLVVTGYYGVRVAPQFITKAAVRDEQVNTAVSLLRECFPLAISLFLMNLVINMSKYGIEFVMDDTAQGYFNMIFMPAQIINLCSQFMFKPYLKQYAEVLTQKATREFYRMIKKQLSLVAAFTLLCCVGAYLIGIPVLSFVYNKNLSGFTVPLTLVVLGGGIYACCQLFYYIMVILRRQKSILLIYVVAMTISVLLTFVMVSAHGIVGAVLAFAATHLLLSLIYFWNIRFALQASE